ncbi:carboxymuconolactone decarboxylase family protein [Pelosinus propionicus]|uniref:Carboxymuconolactone decarboxylase family protein n=1 Tax=Pelosinus propionicus DSM 13327 TaxID=1123291 RepID=A0A1I4HK34_9FIRM|nr:carboxymuconolactone decarboxylase family protein [Pelosinus propionicus]SFL41756.1 Carboxymuconolactone decarboxylase family protein [Pelosinus propionicus DSM 13327]
MRKKIAAILTGVFLFVISMTAVSQAQTAIHSGLNAKQQGMVTIAAFTARGDLERLKIALNEGLDVGLTVNEIKEILVQMYAYCGFPRSLNGITTFMNVLEERKAKGIRDEPGREASPLPAGKSSVKLGTEIQTSLVGVPVSGPVYAFAPAIDEFLKGHLFGDIFGRDILDFQSREIATIAALASMNGVNNQLRSHFNVGLNVGLTEAQLKSLISVLEARVGKQEADNAQEVLRAVLNNR